jgi:hypothetical protein
MDVWSRCAEKCDSSVDNKERLQLMVLELCDRNLITFSDVNVGMPVGIYPLCGAQVFLREDQDFSRVITASRDLLIEKQIINLDDKIFGRSVERVVNR